MRTCKDCEYIDGGLCKRYPPTITFPSDYSNAVTIYPEIEEHDWCGEFKKINKIKDLYFKGVERL